MSYWRWVALSILGLSSLAFSGDAPWILIKSPHFSVATDAGERRGREVALHFEQMRGVFGTLMVKAKVSLPVPLQIVAFRNTKEMRQCAPLWHGKPTQVDGLFVGGEDQTFILLDMSVENPWQVVFHEYAHQLMNANLAAETDPWFEEGFAEYFSSIELDSKEARVGKVPEEEYRVLDQTGMLKVADLFRVQQNSKTYNENGDHRSGFYAQSGMVVHYLYDNQLFSKLSGYFDLVHNQKLPVEDAIQKAFGVTAAQFDKQLRAYESSQRYIYYPIPTPAGIESKKLYRDAACAVGRAGHSGRHPLSHVGLSRESSGRIPGGAPKRSQQCDRAARPRVLLPDERGLPQCRRFLLQGGREKPG
ncbi:MAG TPA: DUF1570 domain-containing protein [Terriglobales bacterium]|nr:DUF1570 domain-containing protein [Terriglobales bacterium]